MEEDQIIIFASIFACTGLVNAPDDLVFERRLFGLIRPVQSDHQNLNETMHRARLGQFLQLPGKG